MAFNSWLQDNVSREKSIPKGKHVGDTIILEERDNNVDMTVEIRDAPETVMVIRPQSVGSLSVLLNHGGWTQGCDYLLLGHDQDRYYAVFVELKKTVKFRKDGEENLSLAQKEVRDQLLWSQPLFHYILSVFRVDNRSSLSESDFTVSYFIFGQQPLKQENKMRIRRDRASLFGDEIYDGIRIRTSYVTVVSFEELLMDGHEQASISQ